MTPTPTPPSCDYAHSRTPSCDCAHSRDDSYPEVTLFDQTVAALNDGSYSEVTKVDVEGMVHAMASDTP